MTNNTDIIVHKRDGTTEPFEKEKLFKVAVATGLSEDQAKTVIDEINEWALKEKNVQSTEIRERFSNKLKEIKPSAAALYEWYQSVKQKNLETDYDLKTS